MRALLAGLATLDVVHRLDAPPSPITKATSSDHLLAAGGPATNAALTVAALSRIREGDAAAVALLTAVGAGPAADLIRADVAAGGVRLLDAADTTASAGDAGPAVSSIIEHPDGRHISSTDGRVPTDVDRAAALLGDLGGEPDTVLVDGHNPELAQLALPVGLPATDDADPFAEADAAPAEHLRVYDGGSWRPWIPRLLPLVDVAMVSADFAPPMVSSFDGLVDFMAGFGITRVIRTDGSNTVQWSWDGARGRTDVTPREAISTMGAGDIVHGAFAWALAGLPHGGRALADPAEVLRFATDVAGISTESFGTRAWMDDPRVADLVSAWRARRP